MNRTLTALCLAAALAFAGTASAGEKLAEQHIAKGLQCQTCHGPDMKNPQMPKWLPARAATMLISWLKKRRM